MNALSRAVAKRTATTTRKDNRGFSLVELIIVIAIMAVLTAILAPQLIKYIERARIQKDESACDEVLRAVQLALAEESVYTAVGFAGATVTVTSGSISTTVPALDTAIKETIPSFPTFTSKLHGTGGTKTTYTITISSTMVVTASW